MNDELLTSLPASADPDAEIARRKIGILLGKARQSLEVLEHPGLADDVLVSLGQVHPLLATVQQEAFRLEDPRIPNEEFSRVLDAVVRRIRSSHPDIVERAAPIVDRLDAERSRLTRS